MNESQFTKGICRWIEKAGGLTIALVGGVMQTLGTPDRFFVHPRWSGWVEFKKKGNRLSPAQANMLGEMDKAGCACCVLVVDPLCGRVAIQDGRGVEWSAMRMSPACLLGKCEHGHGDALLRILSAC